MFETYEDMVTIDDVCQMLNIGKNNAYRLLKEGKLHAFKIEGFGKYPDSLLSNMWIII